MSSAGGGGGARPRFGFGRGGIIAAIEPIQSEQRGGRGAPEAQRIGWEHLPDDLVEAVHAETKPAPGRPGTHSPSHAPSDQKLADISRTAIQQAVQQTQGNLSAAARQLGISRQTLYRKLH